MTIKEVRNEKEGNNIEAIIFNRVKRHIFMLYPFADVRVCIASVVNEKEYRNGIHILLESEGMNFVMQIPAEFLIKMIAQEFYNPFFEDSLREILKGYIAETENYKKGIKSGARMPDNKSEQCLYVFFRSEKPSVLKRLLGGLKLW